MTRILFVLAFLLVLSACDTKAIEPKFQKIENISVDQLNASQVSISADAVIFNPNPVSIYLNAVALEVFANDLKVSDIVQTKRTEIAKKANFSIPLAVSFNPTTLFKNNLMGLIASALSSYQEQKVALTFKGHAQFEVKGLKFTVPIQYEDEILLQEE